MASSKFRWFASAVLATWLISAVAIAGSPTVYVDDDFAGTTPGDDPDGGGPAINFGVDSFATIQDAIDTVSDGIIIMVAEGSYAGATISHPVILDAGGQAAVVNGASPALTVTAPATVKNGFVFNQSGADATILVLGSGGLILQDCTVNESSSSAEAAVQVDVGGSLDLSSGDNTVNVMGAGRLFDYSAAAGLDASTTTLQQDGGAFADDFAIASAINDGIEDAAAGLVTWVANTIFVEPNNAGATNNDYTRLLHAIEKASNGNTINLQGTFDWSNAFALTSWEAANDGIAGNGDDWALNVPDGLNGVTLTAPGGLGSATLQGPGDLAVVTLEATLVFFGQNQNWTISELEFLDFDLGVGFFNSAAGVTAYNNLVFDHNRFRIPADLNATVAPADTFQNIGLHYSFGNNQTISNNIFEFEGNGVSDSANLLFATSVGMQSNTSGGAYEGLQIIDNELYVLNAQSADPEAMLGIWENGHGHTRNITVSGNSFTNLDVGNDPTLNLQRAFRVTSHSGVASTVTYSNNSVSGANTGFQWLAGQNFAAHQHVQVISNSFTDCNTGLLVQSNGRARLSDNTFTNSGAMQDVGRGVDILAGSRVIMDTSVAADTISGMDVAVRAQGQAEIDGSSLTGNGGAGVEADGGTAVIANCDLTGNGVGIRALNDALVDAGDTDGDIITGLGSSAGNNDLTGYIGGGNYAIENLNLVASLNRFVDAQNNNFGNPVLVSFVESVLFDDTDDANNTLVEFDPPQNVGATAAIVWVDDDWAGSSLGDDAAADGPGGNGDAFGVDQFATIQDAIDNVAIGGLVIVLDGSYVEDLTIDNAGLEISGSGIGSAVIDGVATEPQAAFPLATPNIKILSEGVSIHGFTIRSPDAAAGDYASGIVLDSPDCEIYDNEFVSRQNDVAPVGPNDSLTNVAIQTYSGSNSGKPSNVDGLYIHDNSFTSEAGKGGKGYYGIYINPQGEPVGVALADRVVIDGNSFDGNIWRAVALERGNAEITENTIDPSSETLYVWGGAGVAVRDFFAATIDDVAVERNSVLGADSSMGQGFANGILLGSGGETLTNVSVSENELAAHDTAVRVNASAGGIALNNNSVEDVTALVNNGDAADLNASANWWGSNDEAVVSAGMTGSVDFTPYLDSNADVDGGADGFQGDFATLDVTSLGAQTGALTRVREGIALLTNSTINLNSGTYVENGQILIDKDVEIVGDPSDRPVIKPNQNTGTSGDARGWWLLEAGNNLDLQNLVLDGDGFLINIGVIAHGTGSADNCLFRNIKYQESGPSYAGRGIAIYDANWSLTNIELEQIGRIGLYMYGAAVTNGVIDNCKYTGKGDGDFLDYAFELEGGAVATITNSSVTDCRGVADSDGSTSAGMLATTYFAPGTFATVTNCSFRDNTVGIAIGYLANDTTGLTANYNQIYDNDYGLVNTSDSVVVDAEYNYWGDSSGPLDDMGTMDAGSPPCFDALDMVNADGLGNAVTDENVDYCPWLLGNGTMELVVDGSCPDDALPGEPGFQIAVDVLMNDVLVDVTGYQAFVNFDSTNLSFNSALSSYSGSPFTLHIQPMSSALVAAGELQLDGTVGFFDAPVSGNAVLATLIFDVTMAGDCQMTSLDFDAMADSTFSFAGDPVATGLVGTDDFKLDDTAPSVTTVAMMDIGDCYPDVLAAETAALAITDISDNCTAFGNLVIDTQTSGDCEAVITITVTDECGNSAFITYDTRIDSTPPTVTPLGSINSCYASEAAAIADAEAMTDAFDNCTTNGLLTFDTVVVGDCSAVVTVTVTDECGNSDFIEFNTRIDSIDPVATMGSIDPCYLTQLDAENAAKAATGVSDNCTLDVDLIATMTAVTTGDPCAAVITVTLTDECGNTDSVVYNTRIDNEGPVMMCSNVSVVAEAGGCSADVALISTAEDNCDGVLDDMDISFIIDLNTNGFDMGDPVEVGSGSIYNFPSGVTPVRAICSDTCMNMSNCDFTVEVSPVNMVTMTVRLANVLHGVGGPPTPLTVRRSLLVRAKNGMGCSTDECVEAEFTGLVGDMATATVTFPVACGNWTSICVKDQQHTLFTDGIALNVVGLEYEAASMVVLNSGDTDNDSDVDINDVTYFLFRFGLAAADPTVANPCVFGGIRDADFSLNGFVGIEDYGFLTANFLDSTTCPCSMLFTDATGAGGDSMDGGLADLAGDAGDAGLDSATAPERLKQSLQYRISTSQLPDEVATAIDANFDGVIDWRDVRAFERANGLPNELSKRLQKLTPELKSEAGR